MNLYDRIRASLGYVLRPPIRERETCEEQAIRFQRAEIAAEKSYSVCGDPEDYYLKCELCGKPVCEKHRSPETGMHFACELAVAEALL